MTNFALIFIFILGLNIGSFLNCISYRLFKKQSFSKGRSYCPSCKHNLSFEDLIPLLSFLFLKGRCRYCKKSISLQYPLVEIATGLIFLLVYNFQAPDFSGFLIFNTEGLFNFSYYLLISCFLIIIFIYDLEHYIILDKVIYPAILITGLWQLSSVLFFNTYSWQEFLTPVYVAFLSALFFFALVVLSRGKGMGVGDVKFAFFMGLFLSFPNILIALFLSFFLGAIVGGAMILFGKKTLKSEVPFAPFLVTGTFIAMFFGEYLMNLYQNIYF